MKSRLICLVKKNNQIRKKIQDSEIGQWQNFIITEKEIVKNVERAPLVKGVYRFNDDAGCCEHLFIYDQISKEEYVYLERKNRQFLWNDSFLQKIKLFYYDEVFHCNSPYLWKGKKKYQGERIKPGDEFFLLGFHLIVLIDGFLVNDSIVADEVKFYHIAYPEFSLHWKSRGILPKRIELPFLEKPPLERKNYRQLGPPLTMAFGTLGLTSLQIYSALQEGRSYFSLLAILLLPLCVAFTSIFWPLYYHRREKREYQSEYLAFLKRQQKHNEAIESNFKEALKAYKKQELCFFFRYQALKEGTIPLHDEWVFSLGIGKNPDIEEDSWPIFWQKNSLDIYEHPSNNMLFLEKILLEMYSTKLTKDYYFLVYDPFLKLSLYCVEDYHLFHKGRRMWFSDKNKLYKELSMLDKEKCIYLGINEKVNVDIPYQIHYFIHQERPSQTEGIWVNDNRITRLDENDSFYSDIPINNRELFLRLALASWQNKKQEKTSFYRFSDLSKIDLSYYEKHSGHSGLSADFAYIDGEIMAFDLSEKADGPHGLIAGTTGSGKSELLCSMLMNLCVYNPPEKVNLILIDYKGATLSTQLSYKGKTIPHIVGELSDISAEDSVRLQISLRNECKRRERLFLKLATYCHKPIIHLDEYRQNIPQKYQLPILSHLFIVVDEFAQLKEENPRFLNELLQISRLGRSLGIHLLLATQKPSVCVSEEILANCRFRIALKMLETSDSISLIGNAAAFYLKEAGEFVVRKEDMIARGKSLYGGAWFSLETVSLCTRNFDEQMLTSKTWRETVCEQLCQHSYAYVPKPFLPPKARIYSPLQREKLEKGNQLVLGEIDDYIYGQRYPYLFPLKEGNSLLIVGDKKRVLSCLFASSSRYRIPLISVRQNEILDGVSSDIVTYQDEEKMELLFHCLYEGENDCLRILLIEDVDMCVAYSERWKENFVNLMQRLKHKKIIPILCVKSCLSLHYRLLHLLNYRISIGPMSIEDSLHLWSEKRTEENLCEWKGRILSWQPAASERKWPKRYYSPFLKEIPSVISATSEKEKILLGVNLLTHQEIWADNTIVLLAEKEESFEEYRSYLYCRCYSKEKGNLPKRRPTIFCWLDEGLHRQNLFPYRQLQDLQAGECLLVEGNRYIKGVRLNGKDESDSLLSRRD